MLRLMLLVLCALASQHLMASHSFAQDATSRPAAPADQDAAVPAQLVADDLYMEGTEALVASGAVEVFHEGVRLQAERLRYERATGALQIEGPIRLTDPGGTVILADSAELSAGLRNGIIRGAKLVLAQQLQIAAAEMNRVGGRYTQLYKTVASSCIVCAENPTPLWEIRASRVIHDQQERQLYFNDAQLRVMGVPVLYAPRLRLPDPSLKRATGFLNPTIRSTSQLGTGLKLPYFIKLGDHRDLTLTPYLSSSTTTLGLRYRQAFRNGDLSIRGAITDDDVRPDITRGYLFAKGAFRLPRDFRLDFGVELTSDSAYLLDYDYSDKDRLRSGLALSQTRRDSFFNAELTHIRSLRVSEDNDTIPSIIGDVSWQKRFEPALIGGNAELSLGTSGLYRSSSTAGIDGRDVGRISGRLDWRRDWILRNGMIAGLLSEARADFIDLQQEDPGDEDGVFTAGTIGAELRWPMAMTGPNGASHLLEPVAQILWTGKDGSAPPNEDSTLLEFDEGNLFSLSRFPGYDRIERGLRANLGVTWTRFDPAGWSLGLTVGRIFRDENLGQFSQGSGLEGAESDWLTAVQLKLSENLTLTNRALFDDAFRFTRNETRIAWNAPDITLASSYIWLDAAPVEDRPQISEWSFDTIFDIGEEGWRAKTDWRYDFIADRAARAGVGLVYETECARFDLSLSRRFTSSTSVEPTTSVGISVELLGAGSPAAKQRALAKCNG